MACGPMAVVRLVACPEAAAAELMGVGPIVGSPIGAVTPGGRGDTRPVVVVLLLVPIVARFLVYGRREGEPPWKEEWREEERRQTLR